VPAATKIDTLFLEKLSFFNVFSSDFANGITVFGLVSFGYPYAPPLRTLFQVFPGENITPFSEKLVIEGLGIVVIVDDKRFSAHHCVKVLKDGGVLESGFDPGHVKSL